MSVRAMEVTLSDVSTSVPKSTRGIFCCVWPDIRARVFYHVPIRLPYIHPLLYVGRDLGISVFVPRV
jgi:hypothetical protein